MNFTLKIMAHKNASAIVLAGELSRKKRSIIDINRNTPKHALPFDSFARHPTFCQLS